MDILTQKENLRLPCAELSTANLVEKNMHKLFPKAKISIEEAKPKASIAYLDEMRNVHKIDEELEKDLFESEVA